MSHRFEWLQCEGHQRCKSQRTVPEYGFASITNFVTIQPLTDKLHGDNWGRDRGTAFVLICDVSPATSCFLFPYTCSVQNDDDYRELINCVEQTLSRDCVHVVTIQVALQVISSPQVFRLIFWVRYSCSTYMLHDPPISTSLI